jgi:hypothetical protein
VGYGKRYPGRTKEDMNERIRIDTGLDEGYFDMQLLYPNRYTVGQLLCRYINLTAIKTLVE